MKFKVILKQGHLNTRRAVTGSTQEKMVLGIIIIIIIMINRENSFSGKREQEFGCLHLYCTRAQRNTSS
jgi:hypothetical protein